MTNNKKPLIYVLVAMPWLVLILVSPVIGTLAINEHSRTTLIETWSHWASKRWGATAVFCGDSLIAGGHHWGPKLGLGYLTTRNLAGNGYTIKQITSQVRKAAVYKPDYIFVAAGTNDAFQILSEHQNFEETLVSFRELLNTAQYPVILMLPPPTRNQDLNDILTELRKGMLLIAQEFDIRVIDVWPEFTDEDGLLKVDLTTDGVHFTDAAYEILSDEINDEIFR